MANLDVIKDYFLRVVLEESGKFNALSEEEKQKALEKMAKMPEAKQRELCRFFVSEEKDTLPAKIFMRFVQKMSNSMTALNHVAEKDKGILKKYQENRTEKSHPSI